MESLVPVCIYKTGENYQYITVGSKDGCILPIENDNIVLEEQFYCVNPIIRPVPSGMCIVKCFQSTKRENTIGHVTLMYDVYNITGLDDKKSTYFITYISPTINTRRLYTWHNTKLDAIYMTFDSKWKGPTKDWVDDIISPIYVVTNTEVPYSCNNLDCVPYEDSATIYNQGKKFENLSECLTSCAVKGRLKDYINKPNLLYQLNIENYEKPYDRLYITFCIIMIIWSLIIIIYYLIKKRN